MKSRRRVNSAVGFLLLQMLKLISLSPLLLGTVLVVPAQQPTTAALSGVDKTAIVESVLDLELRNQQTFPDVANIRNVSSENIQFMSTSQLSKHGFTLVPANQLCEWQARR